MAAFISTAGTPFPRAAAIARALSRNRASVVQVAPTMQRCFGLATPTRRRGRPEPAAYNVRHDRAAFHFLAEEGVAPLTSRA